MKIPSPVLAALAVILTLVVVDHCARRDERQKLDARQHDTRTDSTVARLQQSLRDTMMAFNRQRDSTGRVIRILLAKVKGASAQPPMVSPVGGELAGGASAAPTDLQDSLIVALTAGRAQDSLQMLIWRAVVVQRDSVIGALQTARDAWRAQAQRPRHVITDVGGGAIIGYGVAERNETVVLVGAGVILLPRALGVVRRLF